MSNEIMSPVSTEVPAPQKSTLSVFSNAESFNLAARMADALAGSTIVPAAYQKNPGNCMIAIEMASRIGTSPMMVMQNLYIIHGNPAWSSQWIIAMINSSHRYKTELQFEIEHNPEDGGLSCRAWAEDYYGHRVEGPKITMKMANDEGWTNKSGSKWKTMPEVMIRYRAASFFGRINCPDMIMGIYSQEEVIEMGDSYYGPTGVPANVNPVTGEIIETEEAYPQETHIQESTVPEDPPITQEQRQQMFQMARRYFGQDANEALKAIIIGHGYLSTNGMPVSVYNAVLDEIMQAADELIINPTSEETVEAAKAG